MNVAQLNVDGAIHCGNIIPFIAPNKTIISIQEIWYTHTYERNNNTPFKTHEALSTVFFESIELPNDEGRTRSHKNVSFSSSTRVQTTQMPWKLSHAMTRIPFDFCGYISQTEVARDNLSEMRSKLRFANFVVLRASRQASRRCER